MRILFLGDDTMYKWPVLGHLRLHIQAKVTASVYIIIKVSENILQRNIYAKLMEFSVYITEMRNENLPYLSL
jgi:hypothetical protein